MSDDTIPQVGFALALPLDYSLTVSRDGFLLSELDGQVLRYVSAEEAELYLAALIRARALRSERLRNEELEVAQRVKDMLKQDQITGEHPDATPLDYVRWALEEIEENSERNPSSR